MAKIVVNEDNKKGLENDEGKEIMPCEYDNIEEFGCYDIFKVIKNGKEGLINDRGKFIIPCKYDEIKEYSLYKTGEYYKENGFLMSEDEFYQTYFDNPTIYFFTCKKDNKTKYIDDEGLEVKEKYIKKWVKDIVEDYDSIFNPEKI